MLTIFGRPEKKSGFCDGVSRRGFLTIGGAAMGGLALSQILAMEAQAGIGSSHKAIINVYLPGGPPHMDMWDLKPDAPAEIRGEFNPISTNVPGIQICELFPQDRRDDGQVRHHPLARRFRRRPRRLPVHDRPQAQATAAPGGGWPIGRRVGVAAGRAGRTRPCRRTWR